MAQLCNVRLDDSKLYTLTIKNGKWDLKEPQSEIVDIQNSSRVLAFKQWFGQIVDFNSDVMLDFEGNLMLPGLIDVHIHSRDPGLTHKEDWFTIERCASRGGVVAVVDMPNTIPAMMDKKSVIEKTEIASKSGIFFRLLLGVGEKNIADLSTLLRDKDLPLCGIKVFYGQSTGNLMYSNLERLAQELKGCEDKVIVFHSEDQCCVDHNASQLKIEDFGTGYSQFRYHSAVRSSQTAHSSTRKILDWAVKHPFKVHIAHVSTPLEIELIQEARSKGGNISCEVAPHHLIFDLDDYDRLGPFVKMNPPIRSRDEVNTLLGYFGNGLVEIFSTDHAPHTFNEKNRSYAQSPSGVPSLDFFTPLLLDCASKSGLGLSKAITLSCQNAADLFGFTDIGPIEVGNSAHFQLVNDRVEWQVSESDVISKCGWTPYSGLKLRNETLMTVRNAVTVYCKARSVF